MAAKLRTINTRYACTFTRLFTMLSAPQRSINTSSFFFDRITTNFAANSYKMGLHLDSIVKASAISILQAGSSVALYSMDKLSVAFVTKKSTENLWSSVYAVFARYRRDHLNSFKLFWYSSALLSFFIFLI